MSYRKLARYCWIGTTVGSLAFSIVMVAVTPLGLAFVPIAFAVAIVLGALAYALIRFVWVVNGDQLARKGHRW